MEAGNNQNRISLFKLVLAMIIYSTLGIMRRYLDLPSGVIAMARGFIGAAFLLILVKIRRKKPYKAVVHKNIGWLVLSGAVLGLGWVALFEAYRFTTVATATLCYYIAPVLVILSSAVLFREQITVKKGICAAVSLVGMVFASGVLQVGFGGGEITGVLIGLVAAALYAAMILLNMKLREVPAYERAIIQLAVAGVVLIPYNLLTVDWSTVHFSGNTVWLLLVAGVVQTGVAYAFYFGSMAHLTSQTVAIMSYIDPVMAVIFSGVLLHESIGTAGIVGAVLVLGSAMISEVPIGRIPARRFQACGAKET